MIYFCNNFLINTGRSYGNDVKEYGNVPTSVALIIPMFIWIIKQLSKTL